MAGTAQLLPPLQQPTAPARGILSIDQHGRVYAATGGHPALLATIRAIPGAEHDPLTRRWYLPDDALDQLRQVGTWVETAELVAARPPQAGDGPVRVTSTTRHLYLDAGGYDAETARVCRMAGGELINGVWQLDRGSGVTAALDIGLDRGIVAGDDHPLTRRVIDSMAMLRLSQATSSALEPRSSIARALHGFQVAGVEYTVRANGKTMLCGDVGAGKTTVALASLEQLMAYPAVAVVPAGLRPNWLREARAVIPHRTAVFAEGMIAADLAHAQPDLLILNYDILGDPSDARSWAAQIIRSRACALVVDEGHRANNRAADRTKTLITMSKRMRSGARLLLSATPVRNQRRELGPLLDIIGRAGQFGGDRMIASDPRIGMKLAANCMWRPRTADVLDSLGITPEGGIEPVWNLTAVEGDPAVMAVYREAEEGFIRSLTDQLDRHGIIINTIENQAAMANLQRIAFRAKYPAIRSWLHDQAATDDPLLIFAFNRDVLDALAGITGAEQIHGGVDSTERLRIVDDFQAGRTRAICLQIDAAGEGLTITRAWHQLHAQLSWTWAAHIQAAGRSFLRMNDPHSGWVHMPYVPGTIEERVTEAHAVKRAEMRFATEIRPEQIEGDGSGDVTGAVLATYAAQAGNG